MRRLAWSILGASFLALVFGAKELALFLALVAILFAILTSPDPRKVDARRRNRQGDRW
jgi:hypothetical protein